MRMTIFDTPVISHIARALAWAFLKLNGWKREGERPSVPKYVLIGSPHTSNWDVPFVLSLAFAYRQKIFFMMKDSAFRWPFGGFCRWLGGIPVDRKKAHGLVAQTIDVFNANEELVICVPPEGTRGKTKGWKTGFYYIALGAKVPICMGFMDFKRKAGGLGPLLYPSGDIEADMKVLYDFYVNVTGKNPELRTLPILSPKEERGEDENSDTQDSTVSQ